MIIQGILGLLTNIKMVLLIQKFKTLPMLKQKQIILIYMKPINLPQEIKICMFPPI